MKCEKCGYISFDYNLVCPACNKDLGAVRKKLGIGYTQPEITFDEFFTGPSGAYATSKGKPAAAGKQSTQEAELELDSNEEFEFTLDD